MRKILFDIHIGPWRFTYANKVEITRSVELLTETCNITLPRRVFYQGRDIFSGANRVIKAGDPVVVSCGYEEPKEVFRGYVSSVKVDNPMVIECQDAMYLLKKTNVEPHAWRSASLSQVVNYIAPQIENIDTADMGLGTFRITNKPTAPTSARVLQYLCENYAIKAYFLRGRLHVGLTYETVGINTFNYYFKPRSWSDAIISHNLKYNEPEDIKIKVRAISIQNDNTRLEAEAGDPDGELRTLHYQNLSQDQLQKEAEASVETLKVAGYSGSFTAFGEPMVLKSDIVRLHSQDKPEGIYSVEEVKYSAGNGIGIRQEITLGYKIQ